MNFYNAALVDLNFVQNLDRRGLRNRLLSFADIDTVKGAFSFWLNPAIKDKKLFVDSGAFSAYSRGAVIDIKKYCEWLHLNKGQIEVYASLDVIGDWKKSAVNTETIERAGLHPLPTFHYNSPLSELHRLLKTYDYIALGGLVPLSRRRDELKRWLDICFTIVKKYFPKKIHLLGMTAQWVLERYPAYSCDSTAAILGGGMGRLMKFERGKLSGTTWRDQIEVGKQLDCSDKLVSVGSAHVNRRIANIKVMLAFEKHITDLWTKRGITW